MSGGRVEQRGPWVGTLAFRALRVTENVGNEIGSGALPLLSDCLGAGFSFVLGHKGICSRGSESNTDKKQQDRKTSSPGGDSEEMAAYLIDQYGNAILRLGYSFLHNLSDAEDVLQETMLRYLKAKPIFENQAHEKAWLLRVASNISKDKLSYNKVRETDELTEALEAEGRNDLSFVWEAVRLLPVKYREVIHLYYGEGYSTAQIAQILKEKESTVRSNMRRGRQKLKMILKEEYDFYE